MPSEFCREVFKSRPVKPSEFVAYCIDRAPGGQCEQCSVSEHSPGAVGNGESLARLAFHPFHFDSKTGELTHKIVLDAFDKGLSVFRLKYATADFIRAKAEAMKRPNRQESGTIEASAEAVRRVENAAGERAFAIYDTAGKADNSHADVCAIQLDDLKGPRKTDLMDELFAVFGPLKPF